MEKIVKLVGLFAVALGLTASLLSCNPEPAATDLEFSYATFDTDEGDDEDYISVYLLKTPYKYPVVVDMEVEMLTGKDHEGRDFMLDEVIEFITTDQTYTVTSTGDRTAKIEGVEVTYTEYNKKIYFKSKGDEHLQSETITIEFRLTKVDGSEIGSISTTTLTIVDDEKAPLVKVGYYDTTYEAPAEATREGKGQFYMRLQKVGKYEYVASELFGLSRPRLLGIFNPEAKTITFDGTDYDHVLWKKAWEEDDSEDKEPFEPVNAFQNDTIWAYSYNSNREITQVLKLQGAGANGNEPIVMTTEAIEENSNGVILSIDTHCGFAIYNYNNGMAGSIAVGDYDSMEQSESMTFSTTNYPSEVGTRSMGATHPTPFSAWSIE